MAGQVNLEDFFRFYRSLPHQIAAVRELSEALPPELLKADADWVQTYRAAGKQPELAPPQNPLRVRYFSQRDSNTAHAFRMCFSSSCAMMLDAIKPGVLRGPNGDDLYLGRVLRHGDTTDPTAQIRALRSYGVQATLRQTVDFDLIKEQIDIGIPVPCGFLHQGHVSKPSGQGHWLCVIGYDESGLIVNDPFGDLDLVNGKYLNNWGARLHYSYGNFQPRWMVEGPKSGWAIIATL